ncbi:MAG: FliO/MopB family protein [Bdellovibrio sp.]
MRWLVSLLFVMSTVSAFAAEEVPSAATSAAATVAAEVSAEAAPVKEGTVAAKEIKVDNRKESEIPLNLDGSKKTASDGTGWFRILLTLSMLGVVGTGAYIFIKKQSVPKERKHQTQIKVLQQHYLGPKKSLAIVRVAGESILIGVTDHNISMIKSLALLDDEVPEEAPKSFGKVMGSFGNESADFVDEADIEEPAARVSFKTRSRNSQSASKEVDADDEFAISGIKDIVSKRLKGMRSFQ